MQTPVISTSFSVALILVLTACDSTTSDDVSTSDLYAEISINFDAGSDSARVDASLYKLRNVLFNNRTYIELICPDMLVANSSTQQGSMVLRQNKDFYNEVYYYRDIYGEAGDIFTVSLLRDADHTSAESSNVIIPDNFSISAPLAGSYSRRSGLNVSWTPSGSSYDTAILVSGICIDSYSVDINGDPGTYTIPANALILSYYPEPDAPNYNDGNLYTDTRTCPIQIHVSKKSTGTLDQAFRGGRIVGYNSSEVTVSSYY